MKKLNKNFILIFLSFILTLFVFKINVYANDKEYNIPNATFDVKLQENGNAIITECWTINYTKGDFTRFYKDIYKNVTKLEEFSNITILDCKIQDIDAYQVNNTIDRQDYTYYVEQNENYYTIHWFKSANKTTIKYEITYLLEDVVKETDNNTALFCYRFIGVNFPKKVDETKVTIELPENAIINLNFGDQDDYYMEDNKIILNKKNVKGVLKYNISTTSSIFNNLKYISLEDIHDEENVKNKESSNSFSTNVSIIFIGILLLNIIICLTISYVRKKKLKDKLLQNPNYINDIKTQLERENIHPLQLVDSSTINANQFLIAILFDLCRRNEAYFTKEELILAKNIINITNVEKEVLNLLFLCFKSRETIDYYAFSLAELSSNLKDEDNLKFFIKDLNKIKNDYLEDNFLNKNLRQIRNDIFLYYKIANYNTNIYDCIYYINKYHTIDYLYILYILYKYSAINTKPNKSSSKDLDFDVDFEFIDEFCDILSTVHTSSSSSSSGGCSSCSSCSSCGGCGGGGAD